MATHVVRVVHTTLAGSMAISSAVAISNFQRPTGFPFTFPLISEKSLAAIFVTPIWSDTKGMQTNPSTASTQVVSVYTSLKGDHKVVY
jgi:hypothetical protein